MRDEPITVIGMGADGAGGLSKEALAHIQEATVLAGGQRHLDCFPDWQGERIRIDRCLNEVIAEIGRSRQGHRVAVLASGDPLFYGIGRRLLEAFSRQELRFIPHVSSVQLAFARIGLSYEQARVVSLHGEPIERVLAPLHFGEPLIAVFTDRVNTPTAVAELLNQHSLAGYYDLWVCEALGSEHERVQKLRPAQVMEQTFSPLNVTVLVEREKPASSVLPPAAGLPPTMVAHRGQQSGQITKPEVRLASLAQLEFRAGDCFWDIGAGSGSVAIEAARLCPRLRVYAVERNSADVEHVRDNVRRFGLDQVQCVHGEAPNALKDLPDPDAVFIGGNGGRLMELLETATSRLNHGGRLVLNCVCLETLATTWTWLRERGFEPEATNIQVSRSQPLAGLTRFEPEAPITIVKAYRS